MFFKLQNNKDKQRECINLKLLCVIVEDTTVKYQFEDVDKSLRN